MKTGGGYDGHDVLLTATKVPIKDKRSFNHARCVTKKLMRSQLKVIDNDSERPLSIVDLPSNVKLWAS